MTADDKIIAELIRRRDSGDLLSNMSSAKRLPKPLSLVKLAAVEETLGLPLPQLLTRVYTNVANGGFGDSYGFLGLIGGAKNESGLDAIGQWKQFMKPDPTDPRWRWRASLLPIAHLGGCGNFDWRDLRGLGNLAFD